MDNVNAIRVGFFAPNMKIVDFNSEVGDPIDRSGEKYTCVLFINPDEIGAKILTDIESGLPITSSGMDWTISAILPCKNSPAKVFRDQHNLSLRIYCDSDVRLGKMFGIVNSASAHPAYHPTIFVIGEEGSVRYRYAVDKGNFDGAAFRTAVKGLI